MKKIIVFLVALSAAFMVAFSASAADIAVKVDGRTVTFREEPKPVVINDRTYVPVRRVLERMGASVEWNSEERTVAVTSPDNITLVVLTIDSPEILVYTFTGVLQAQKETVVSDVSPIILNDRTMLPIRVIAEALGADVDYDESGIAEITTAQAKLALKKALKEKDSSGSVAFTEAFSDDLPKISLSCDAKDIKKDDTVSVYVRVSDLEKLYADSAFSGFVTTVLYDTENFSYDGFTCIDKDGETSPTLSADNANFYENGAKVAYIYTPDSIHEPTEDGTVVRLDFTALSDNGGSFVLSDGISDIGYDNEILLTSDNVPYSLSKYDELFIDTTELIVK